MMEYEKLETQSGHNLVYKKTIGDNDKPTVVFLGGFMSDMQGAKAIALEKFCQKRSLNYIRFDYFGHGLSDGKFVDGTIGIWKQNVIDVIDNLTAGKLILVGSSMGGWLMLLVTLARNNRVAGLIGIASAPDFTENLIWNKLEEEQKEIIKSQGVFNLKSEYGEDPYPITLNLIEDGREHLLLDNKINVNVPTVLIHGKKDFDVPFIVSEEAAKKLTSNDVELKLIENSDHGMSTDENIELICNCLNDMVEKVSFNI